MKRSERDCQIMMALDLDFWLMRCIREGVSFRNVKVSKLVGTKQLYEDAWMILKADFMTPSERLFNLRTKLAIIPKTGSVSYPPHGI